MGGGVGTLEVGRAECVNRYMGGLWGFLETGGRVKVAGLMLALVVASASQWTWGAALALVLALVLAPLCVLGLGWARRRRTGGLA